MNRFASIATSSPDAPNQFKRPTPGRPLPSSNYAVNLNSSTNGVAFNQQKYYEKIYKTYLPETFTQNFFKKQISSCNSNSS